MTVFNARLSQQAWMVAPDTVRVMEALAAGGGEARFVGGCVRDALVNRDVIDIDIATTLPPEDVIEALKKAKIRYAPTGIRHGTITAIVEGRPFEVTTLRVDVRAFGRQAEVAFTSDWERDAARRDFTINAMSANLAGDVYDPFGGVEHLREGKVVFVGDAEQRIREDYLRILRYFRFFAHYGRGMPDKAALVGCARLAKGVRQLSAERIRQEIFKLLESDRSALVWALMMRTGVVTHFLPEATGVPVLERLIEREREVHGREQGRAYALRRLAALLDVTPGSVGEIAQALKLSNEQALNLSMLAAPPWKVDTRMAPAEVQRLVYRAGNDIARSLLLLAAARSGETGDLKELYQTATAFRAPRFPVVGADLLNLGWKEGPEVGRILEEMSEWWLAKEFVPGRTECLQRLTENYPAPAQATPAWAKRKDKETGKK